MRFECVLPIESDARQVMEWRNDPVVLANSFHSEPKHWDSFWPEFQEAYFPVPGLPPLFAFKGESRVAFLRFRSASDPTGEGLQCIEISIIVAPEWRGKGVATEVLSQCQSWVRHRGYDAIYAEIKCDNIGSLKAFMRAGFDDLGLAIKSLPDSDARFEIHRCLARLNHPGDRKRPQVFVIAEAGANWRMGTVSRDLAMARELIDIAVEAGADACKFQVYRAHTVYAPNAGAAAYLDKRGLGQPIHEIFDDLAMPYEMIPEIAGYCDERGIEFMASPFSVEDFNAVDPFVKRHKIASYELSHLRLLEHAGRCGKPLILSTGAAVETDIEWALHTFRKAGGRDCTLLQCTAQYPADPAGVNLRTIPWLSERFGCAAGLSDHSMDPVNAPVAAVALGATVIEKHYTLHKRLPGPDHAFALSPQELTAMCQAIRQTEQMLGDGQKRVEQCEDELYHYARRGIQALSDIREGEVLKEGVNVAILRPGNQAMGAHPRFLPSMLGKASRHAICAGKGINTEDVS